MMNDSSDDGIEHYQNEDSFYEPIDQTQAALDLSAEQRLILQQRLKLHQMRGRSSSNEQLNFPRQAVVRQAYQISSNSNNLKTSTQINPQQETPQSLKQIRGILKRIRKQETRQKERENLLQDIQRNRVGKFGRPKGSKNRMDPNEGVLNDYFDIEKRNQERALYEQKKVDIAQESNEYSQYIEEESRSQSKISHKNIFKRKPKFQQGSLSKIRNQGTDKQYTIEAPYQMMIGPKNKIGRFRNKYQTDDTRSMWDDPRLKKARMNNQKAVMSALGGQLKQFHQQKKIKWLPIDTNEKLPREYFMPEGFKEQGGLKNVDTDKVKSEYDAFKLFFDDEICDYIVKNTHKHYHKEFRKEVYFYCTQQKIVRPKYENYFTRNDIEGFIGIYLYFGIVKMRNTRDYWMIGKKSRANQGDDDDLVRMLNHRMQTSRKTSQLLKESRTCINQNMTRIMSYERYSRLRTYLRFGPTGQKQNKDPIYKIRELITMLNKKFTHYFYPNEYICIDEGMIPFNGRVGFKIFNPQKPTKWGIKEYVLTDAAIPYTLQIRLHDGAEEEEEENEQNEAIKGKIYNLVLQMVQEYENKNHKLVMDNYYNSPALYLALKARGIGGLGTCRHNRTGLTVSELKSEHFNKIFQNNQKAFYLSDDLKMILMYFLSCASHPIAFLTTFLGPGQTSSQIDLHSLQMRPRKEEIPQILTFYNKYKGGVDRRNSFCAFMRRKGEADSKWWRSVFWRLVETSIINAFVVYKQLYPEAYNQRKFQDFRVTLIIQLGAKYKELKNNYEICEEYAWVKKKTWFKKNGHIMLRGMSKGQCVQCNKEITQNFCQDCSIESNKPIHVCSKQFCRRFHNFSDFEMSHELFESIEMFSLFYEKGNYKTKKIKVQERKISDLQKKQMRNLQEATKKLEREKLDLLVKNNKQITYYNELVDKLKNAQQTSERTNLINSLKEQIEQKIKELKIKAKREEFQYDSDGYEEPEEEDIPQELIITSNDNEEQQNNKIEMLLNKYNVPRIKKYEFEYDKVTGGEINIDNNNPYDAEINEAKIQKGSDTSSDNINSDQQSDEDLDDIEEADDNNEQ